MLRLGLGLIAFVAVLLQKWEKQVFSKRFTYLSFKVTA